MSPQFSPRTLEIEKKLRIPHNAATTIMYVLADAHTTFELVERWTTFSGCGGGRSKVMIRDLMMAGANTTFELLITVQTNKKA